MSHPLYLVNKLLVAIAYTALRVFIHVLDSFYIFRVLLIIQIQKRKQNIQRHNILTPLSGFAHYKVNRNLFSILEHLLNRQSNLRLNTIDAGLMPALVGEDNARFLLDIAN